jgi:hypothetical protein
MTETNLKRELSARLKELAPQIDEGLAYGIPHVVGEILQGEDLEVNLNIVVFERPHPLRLVSDGGLFFIYPAEDSHPYRLFLDLWRFLQGKEVRSLKPGEKVRGSVEEALKKHGYTILWMNVQQSMEEELVQVWAKKGKLRYNMVFRKTEGDELVLLEMSRLQ